jgi:uncharacterized protein with PIN domain
MFPIYTLPDGTELRPFRNKTEGWIETMRQLCPEQIARVEKKRCPICNASIVPSDLRHDLERQEFEISGICKRCQDDVYG